ncbi:hypothetical protein PHLCEN_2v8123 [Hermanssonia centrifuga]|uniref:BTB domain-containing protein n=1 Tax=Hermanssonia centrifuga TaxID=98765 RepID=A0A2R6NUK1_9APHY|nr:hypothetical protein PHLCEN_2v8123 [Hermanssonia centrifuga]
MTSQYFDYRDADLVLRCSSSPTPLDFRVHKCILSAASPFFRDMFTLPQAPRNSDEGDELPIVEVSEGSSTMEMLLRYVYPVLNPTIDTLDDLTVVLEAAYKYDMVVAIETLRTLLLLPRFLEETPTRIYAIASRFELEEEAKVASRYTLKINVLDCPLSEDLKFISAYQYHRLLDLHRQRAKAAQELLHIPDTVKCMMCNGTHYGVFLPPKWWKDFEERAKEELRVRPTTEVIFSMSFLAQSAQTGCERCAMSVLEAHWFLTKLKKSMDELPSTI